jgi:hypothetical protein
MNAAALLRHRSLLERALPWAAVLLTTAAVLAGFLVVEAGPARRFVVFYIAPMVLAFPLWARVRLESIETEPAGRVALDAAVTVLAVLRTLTGALPFSGHMLFLVYSLLTTPRLWYRVVALLLIVETTWFKLGIWSDVLSWSLGLAAGLVSAALYAFLGRRGVGG